MLLFYFYKLLSFLMAAVPLFLPVLVSWGAAQSSRLGVPERVLLTCSYSVALMLLSFGLPGMFGCLSFFPILTCSLVFSSGLFWLSSRFRKDQEEPALALPVRADSRGKRFFLGVVLYGTVILTLSCLMGHLGTDTYFYHLYFPAMWLENGSMAYVPIPGYTCEYYPAYGEMLFGFLMSPMRNADFACLVQPAALTVNAVAVYVMGCFFGASGVASLAAGALVMFTSMVFGNAAMAYTDVLNGAFLTVGMALLCIGVGRRHLPSCIGAGIMLGAASAVKLTGLLLSPVLTFAAMLYFFLRDRKSRVLVLTVAGAAVVVAAPFYLRSWIVTGNPFYPVRLPPLFQSGLEFERSAVGFTPSAWSFFFDGGAWSLNIASGILWGITPFAVPVIVSVFPRCRERHLAVVLAVTLIALFAVQLTVYPEIAQARQYIPWIMMCSTILPIALSPAEERFPCVFLFALLVVLLLVYCSPVSAVYGYALIPISGVALMFMPEKWFRPGIYVAAVLFFVAGSFVSTLREADAVVRKYGNIAAFGPGRADCVRLVSEATERDGRKTIAVNGTKFSFAFMADLPGNRVIAIPINRKNSLHPHEFVSFAEMRSDPVDAEEWIARLDAAGADFLYLEQSDEEERLPDSGWEKRTAEAYPERFLRLFDDGTCTLYQIKK